MKRLSLPISVAVALSSSLALASIPELSDSSPTQAPLASDGLPPRPASYAVAPQDTPRLPFPSDARERVRDLDGWFAANPTQRVHAETDRPLYRPGDTVNVKLWDLATRGLAPAQGQGMTAQLLDPRGTVVQSRYVVVQNGAVNDAFPLDAAAVGGSWTLRVVTDAGQTSIGRSSSRRSRPRGSRRRSNSRARGTGRATRSRPPSRSSARPARSS